MKILMNSTKWMMKTGEQKQDSGELSPPKSPCQAAPCPNGILVVTNVSGDCLGTVQETLLILDKSTGEQLQIMELKSKGHHGVLSPLSHPSLCVTGALPANPPFSLFMVKKSKKRSLWAELRSCRLLQGCWCFLFGQLGWAGLVQAAGRWWAG